MQHSKLLSFLVLFAITATLSVSPSFSAFAQGPDNPGKPEVIAVSGIVPGKNLIVHILLEVPPGADRNEAAYAALASHGARAFTAEEYSLTGLVWDQFSDSNPENDSVIQRYNPQNDPTGGNGLTALLNTHTTWNDVTTSSFAFEYGGETGKCPSLVQECKGRQTFDGNNDVAWLALRDANTLGVTWSGTSTDEADMAMNTNFNWATDGVTNYDVETVFLHENGHVAGIGHSEYGSAIMYPSYQDVNRILDQDDKDALSALYPGTSTPANNSPIVSISNPTDNSSFDSATVISFAGSASDIEDGDVSANLSWTSSIDGSIGAGTSFTNSLSDGTHTITAEVTDAGGKTGSDSITITVGTPPVTGTSVDVDSITYTGSGGKNNDRHLTVSVHISDDSGNDVSGATVSITLTNGDSTWTATGTTGSTGSAGFTLKNSPSGTYTTTVTSLDASGLTWDGTTPTNSYTK